MVSKKFSILAAALFLVAIARLPARCQDETVEMSFSAKTQTNAMIRSLIFPGWGQVFNGAKTKGHILMAAETASILGTVMLFSQASQKYDDYANTGVISGTSYDDYQSAYNTAMLGVGLCATIWIYGVVDAYFASPYKKHQEIQEESFNWHMGLTAKNGLSVGYNYKF